MKLILLFLVLMAAQVRANPTISQARQLMDSQPAEAIRLYQEAVPELTSAPVWLQRDWHLVATSAYLKLRQWSEATHALQAADRSLLAGKSAAEVALLAGALSYQQQRLRSAWYWFRCAETFDAPPETSARLILNLGVIAARHGQDDVAKQYYVQGLALAKSHNFQRLLPLYYNNLGAWYWRHEQWDNAEQQLKKALYSQSRPFKTESQARVMLNLLLVQVSAKRLDKFARYVQEATNLINQQPNPDYPIFLRLLRTLYEHAHNPNDHLASQLTELAQQLKGIALQQSTQRLLAQYGITWQAPADVNNHDVLVDLPNTQAQCKAIAF